MTVTSIKPLSNSQKLFLQRLLVSHILTDTEARDLYNNIRTQFANVVEPDEDDKDGPDPSYMGNSFDHNLGLINASLLPAFNLEICTLLLPPPYDPDSNSNVNNKGNQQLIKYHAVVNKSNDDVAKSHAVASSVYGPHELAYLRLLLEKLVENDISNNGQSSNQKGCNGTMNKMDILNSRNDLEGAHANKLSLPATESALEVFLSEKWLVEMAPPDDDDEEEEEEEERPTKKKRGRKSLKGTFYGIGPRSFLELGEFLVGVGMEEGRMPQIIMNRP